MIFRQVCFQPSYVTSMHYSTQIHDFSEGVFSYLREKNWEKNRKRAACEASFECFDLCDTPCLSHAIMGLVIWYVQMSRVMNGSRACRILSGCYSEKSQSLGHYLIRLSPFYAITLNQPTGARSGQKLPLATKFTYIHSV